MHIQQNIKLRSILGIIKDFFLISDLVIYKVPTCFLNFKCLRHGFLMVAIGKTCDWVYSSIRQTIFMPLWSWKTKFCVASVINANEYLSWGQVVAEGSKLQILTLTVSVVLSDTRCVLGSWRRRAAHQSVNSFGSRISEIWKHLLLKLEAHSPRPNKWFPSSSQVCRHATWDDWYCSSSCVSKFETFRARIQNR